MNQAVEKYAAHLAARVSSASLRASLWYALDKLALYLRESAGLTHWREVESRHLDAFALHLRRDCRTPQGQPLQAATVNLILSRLRTFFAWQTKTGLLLLDPAEDLKPVRVPANLPKIVSEKEVARLIETPATGTIFGLRDRALLETLYATGIRHREAHRLDLYDADLTRHRLTIREGKGGRERIVPLTENAVHWLTAYLRDGRGELLRYTTRKKPATPLPPPTPALWLSYTGRRLCYSAIDQKIAKYARQAQVPMNVHSFRHCCASHLLKHGADIRHIQRLLGHRTLESTQIYLHLDVEDLRQATQKLDPATR
jgi:integrase/recombinase XerD